MRVAIFTSLVLSFLVMESHAALFDFESLAAGTKYRIIFITSTTTDATSGDIATYDALVQAAAANFPAGKGYGTSGDYKAVVSTTGGTVAKTYNTDGDDVLNIYIPNGDVVSSSYSGLWDGSLDEKVQYNELGNMRKWTVWSGTLSDGTAASGEEVGSANPVAGHSDRTNSQWIDIYRNVGNTGQNSVYGMSPMLTSGGTAIPEPGTFGIVGLLATLGIGWHLLRRKRAAKPTDAKSPKAQP